MGFIPLLLAILLIAIFSFAIAMILSIAKRLPANLHGATLSTNNLSKIGALILAIGSIFTVINMIRIDLTLYGFTNTDVINNNDRLLFSASALTSA